MTSQQDRPVVGIIMGSKSDWEVMRLASETLTQLGIGNECRVISAHRAPDALFEYVSQAEEDFEGPLRSAAGAGSSELDLDAQSEEFRVWHRANVRPQAEEQFIPHLDQFWFF